MYAVGPSRLMDSPWDYQDETSARHAFARYSARVSAEAPELQARLEFAETLDALIPNEIRARSSWRTR
jgi:hypothetical protein